MRISDWSSDVCSSDLASIAAVPGKIERAVCFQRRRRHVKAAPPDVDLFISMLGRCLGLVEARQPAIMALVKMPVLFNRQPEPPHFLQRQIQRLDRAGLYRGEAAVEVETPFSHQLDRKSTRLNSSH